MFAVNTYGDIGLISRRALHEIGNGVYASRRNRMAKTATLVKAKAIINVKVKCLK